jgi:4-hydroxybenzoate polyprenyltransferase
MNVSALISMLRPHQWTKNGVLFAGLIFSRNALDPALSLRSLVAFVIFCAVSSASYIVNDLVDLERDRLHPEKRKRAIASGAVSRTAALTIAFLLYAVGLGAAWLTSHGFAVAAVTYTLLILAYSLRLKRMIILDVLVIAVGFVIRAIAGVEALRPAAPTTEVSPWLLVCTLFLALFLATGKRRQEIGMLDAAAAEHRRTLSQYSPALLDLMMGVMTAVTLLAYSTYTIAPGTMARLHTPNLVYTVPFVVYGIFRYCYLVFEERKGGNPAEVLMTDAPLLVDVLLWLAAVGVIIYVQT